MRNVWRLARNVLLAAIVLAAFAQAAQASATLSASPTSAAPGGTVTASWSGLPTATLYDWLGMYSDGGTQVVWFYANSCTHTMGSTAHQAGSCAFTVPAGTAAGSYRLRYYTTSSTLLATSGPLTVTGCASNAAPNIHALTDGCPLYNPGSWVNSPLPANAPVDPNSAAMAAFFRSQIGVADDGSTTTAAGYRWSGAVETYVVKNADRSTFKTVCSREVLNGTSWAWMDQLHNAWMTFKVPVPAGGLTNLDGGQDRGVTLYDPSTNEMWDFFIWRGAAAAGTVDPQGRACDYYADGGDYQHDVANSPGYFINQSLGSGVTESNMWGRRAAALPSAAGAITPQEWDNPLPDFGHTIQIIVPWAELLWHYWPATRHDGNQYGALPEGARVRFDPAYTCPHGTAGSTGPTQLAYDRAYAFCATIQKYGAIITDQTGSGAFYLMSYPDGPDAKPFERTPDGGSCCSGTSPGTQWPDWYWAHGINQGLLHLQVIDQSYRPPFAPGQ